MEQFAQALTTIITVLYVVAFFIVRIRDWRERRRTVAVEVTEEIE